MKRRNLYTGAKPFSYVAFSYSDAARADVLLDVLEENGYRFWLNSKITPSYDDLDQISKRLDASDITVLVLTESSVSDKLINAVIGHTISKRKSILVYITDETEKTTEYLNLLLAQPTTVIVFRAFEQELISSSSVRQALSATKGLTEDTAEKYFNQGIHELKSEGASKEKMGAAMKKISYAADNEYTPALKFLGDVALEKARNGYDTYSSAVAYYKAASDLGNIEAIYMLGCMLADGEGFAKNSSLSVMYLSIAAAKGIADAQYRLAVMLDRGDGVRLDRVEASIMYKRALENGDRRAYVNLAYRYLNGDMLAKDEALAAEYFFEAVKDENINAYFELAKLYREGRVIPKNEKKSAEYFLKAAMAGIPEAQYYYALYLRKQKNYLESFRWLMASVEDAADGKKVNADALYEIAVCYDRGMGVEQSDETAFLYYYASAENGSLKARLAVARCYKKGIGVPMNKKAAAFFTPRNAEQTDKF